MTTIPSFVFSLLLIAPISLISALPNVTAIRIGDGCSAYPTYLPDPSNNFTGCFVLHPDQADNSSINGLHTGPQGTSLVVYSDPMAASELFGCTNGTIFDYFIAPSAATQWSFLTNPQDQELISSSQGIRPETYAHEVDGVRQDGVFLGSANSTTWAFRLVLGAGGIGGRDFYQVRLLEPKNADPVMGIALRDGEFKGFLKVIQP
ncbi:hypothetical protein EG329_000861 [Mollisiaceae sp. DMI_Dod_QoI]|nr:hypothetical protein EG329_000861 [Helotiales sp. DMI_Dod_QoI]